VTAFTFLVGCANCTSIATTFTDHDRRQQFMDSHPASHVTAHFVAATDHPAAESSDTAQVFAPGDSVTFHGSTTDQAADHQPATVVSALRGVDQDGRAVDGWLILVPVQQDDGSVVTYNVFVPTNALASALEPADQEELAT
jgi:predicted lipid-binding transport protein (Tim44 family)